MSAPVQQQPFDREQAEQIADLIVRDVAELPDRTSPDDWPEALLVTSEELHTVIVEHLLALRGAVVDADEAWRAGRPWTVATLGRFLSALGEEERAREVWGAYFVEIDGKSRARTRPLAMSWERTDGAFICDFKNESNPRALVVWSAQDERRADEWRPIETAPLDGTLVDLFHQGQRWTDFYFERGAWLRNEGYPVVYRRLLGQPSHWMPRPADPAARATKGGEA